MGEVAILQTQVSQNLSVLDDIDLDYLTKTMQKVTVLQAYFQKALKINHDYGAVPGTNQLTLLKPGAEKILSTLGITSEYEIIEKVQDYEKGVFAFTVKCVLSKHNYKITEGFGHCNTKEGKYRWRWVTKNKLPVGTITETLVKRQKSGQFGDYFEYQMENEDPYSLANTCLKMAKKRAQVDATLTVASLSEIFTQDMEDIEDLQGDKFSYENPENDDPANIVCSFNKHKGKRLGQILEEDKGYIEWMAKECKNSKLKNAAMQLLNPAKPVAKSVETSEKDVPTDEEKTKADDFPFDDVGF